MRKINSLIITALTLFSSVSVNASEPVQVGRYTSINPVASNQQANILSVVVTIPFNKNVETVGDAINHLLLRSGYQLAALKSSDPMLPVLLNSSLPEIHRKLGPITIENALHVLAGSAWDLVIDPVHRMISFELIEKYQTTASLSVGNKIQYVVDADNKGKL